MSAAAGRRTLTAVLLVAGLGLAALAGTASRPLAQQRERYSVTGDHVAIYNLAGEVRVEPGTGHSVVVEVVRGGPEASQLRVETGPKGRYQTVRVIYPSHRVVYPAVGRGSSSRLDVGDDGTFGTNINNLGKVLFGSRTVVSGSGTGLDAHADLRILVPPGQNLDLYHVAGKVSVTNVDGDLMLDHGMGSITTRGTRGSLDLDTGSGEVRVSDAEGEIDVDTGSGEVTIHGIRGQHLVLDTGSGAVNVSDAEVRELSADTGSGFVDLSAVRADEIVLDTGSGGVNLDLTGDVNELNVDTGSGGVTLRIPVTLGAEFTVETSSGGIKIDAPHRVLESSHDFVRGRFGDGRGRIHVETGSGGVRILSRASSSSGIEIGPAKLLAYAVQ